MGRGRSCLNAICRSCFPQGCHDVFVVAAPGQNAGLRSGHSRFRPEQDATFQRVQLVGSAKLVGEHAS